MIKKMLGFGVVALFVLVAVPASAHGLSLSCEALQKKAVKACPQKQGKRPSSTCRKRTSKLNQCLEEAAKLTPPDSICINLYSPVCAAVRGEESRTYSNVCYATVAGASFLSDGECPTEK